MSVDRLAYKVESVFALAGAGGHYRPDTFAPGSNETFGTVTKTGILFNSDRLFNDFNLLNHTAGIFDELQNAAASRASGKGVGLPMIDLIDRKGCPLMFGMSGLIADVSWRITFCFLRRFDNIRGGWLGRIGGIFREMSDLVGKFEHLFCKFRVLFDKLSVDIKKFGNLFFKFSDTLNIEWFCFESQFSSSSHFTMAIIGRTRVSA